MKIFISLWIVLSLPLIASSDTIVVPDDYSSIQEAINAAQNGDVVLVTPGLYYENIDFLGKAITVRSDCDADADTEDLAMEDTHINGGQLSSVVLFMNNETESSVIKGFTLRNGVGYNDGQQTRGGAIFCLDTAPTISNNIIMTSRADYGGAIDCYGESANPLIEENVIVANKAFERGGAIRCLRSSPTIRHNIIKDNFCELGGGGIDVTDNGLPLIFNNYLRGNWASWGGGIGCVNSSPDICNNKFWKNSAHTGAGIYCRASSPNITNNTLHENSASELGGGICCNQNSFPKITNCILWKNNAQTDEEISADSTSIPDVNYSNVCGGYGGTGIISENPCYLNDNSTKSINLHLASDSPCIDAGINHAPAVQATDFNHEPRIENGTVDMGADEFYAYPPLELHVPSQYLTIQDAIDAAPEGSTIFVAPYFHNSGYYQENIDFLGKAITVVSDKDCDPSTHDIDPLNTQIRQSGNSLVRFISGEGETSVLDGFTLMHGNGTKVNSDYYGGGIYCSYSSPTIKNNIIRNNSCTFGGGIYCESGSPKIINNTLKDNKGSQAGGGLMVSFNADPLIDGNVILNNRANHMGGGISIVGSCEPQIMNNILCENEAEYGGAIDCYWSYPYITNNTIHANTASIGGGAMFTDYNSEVEIYNCILWDNTAPEGPSLFVQGYSELLIEHSCVMGGIDSVYGAPGSHITYGGFGGFPPPYVHMLDEDPLFASPNHNQYKLSENSPCINRGGNAKAPPTDIEGIERPTIGLVEMGAHEYTGDLPLIADEYAISIGEGGVCNFDLMAGPEFASRKYHMLAAHFGTAPGVKLSATVTLPLNLWLLGGLISDPLLTMIMIPNPIFPDYLNQQLDGYGQGTKQFILQPNMVPPDMIGEPFHFAFCTTGPFDFASNAIAVMLTP